MSVVCMTWSPIDITDTEFTLPIRLRIQMIDFLCLGLAMCMQAGLDTGDKWQQVAFLSFFFLAL